MNMQIGLNPLDRRLFSPRSPSIFRRSSGTKTRLCSEYNQLSFIRAATSLTARVLALILYLPPLILDTAKTLLKQEGSSTQASHTHVHTHTRKGEFIPRIKQVDNSRYRQHKQCCRSSLTEEQSYCGKLMEILYFFRHVQHFWPTTLPLCESKTFSWVNVPAPAVIHKSKVQSKKRFSFWGTASDFEPNYQKVCCQKLRNVNEFQTWRKHCCGSETALQRWP